ncbi:MAG: rhomboid family intramembrane serine protease [Fermentimonas sp.]|nr:rhomboid family intramembrane serine protease [Fermentimonas sp.]
MITIIIIVITSLISIRAFKDNELMSRLIFHPPAVKQGNGYRLFSYGVVHADYTHLIFNMFTLYFFGPEIERTFKSVLGQTTGSVLFILLYLSALLVSIIPTYFKKKDNASYYSLGASGAVSAIIFAYVLINPMNYMGILFIPIMLPAFLFGIIFILISISLDKKQVGGINHSAHITGSIYGIIFTIAVFFIFADINLINSFIGQIRINSISDIFYFGF